MRTMSHTLSNRKVRARAGRMAALFDTLETRTLMSADAPVAAPAPVVRAAIRVPDAAVTSGPTTPADSTTVSNPTPAATTQPVTSPNVRVGVDNWGNLTVVAANSSTNTAPANIFVTEWHNYSTGQPTISIATDSGNYTALPLNNFNGVTVTDNTGGHIQFTATDTQLLFDSSRFVSLTSNNGSIDLTSVVPVTAQANNVHEWDTGFFNARDNLIGNNVISEPGGSNLSALSAGAKLISHGLIGCNFYGSNNSLLSALHGNNYVWAPTGSTVAMGDGNDTINISDYTNGQTARAVYVMTGSGDDVVNVYGDSGGIVAINGQQSNGDYLFIQQYQQLNQLNIFGSGIGYTTVARDSSLQFNPDLSDSWLNVNYSYFADLNDSNGKG